MSLIISGLALIVALLSAYFAHRNSRESRGIHVMGNIAESRMYVLQLSTLLRSMLGDLESLKEKRSTEEAESDIEKLNSMINTSLKLHQDLGSKMEELASETVVWMGTFWRRMSSADVGGIEQIRSKLQGEQYKMDKLYKRVRTLIG